MPTGSSSAEWSGNLARGNGTMSLGSGAFEGSYSFASRFGSGEGTNPEELIAAADAGCFSMALAAALSQADDVPRLGRDHGSGDDRLGRRHSHDHSQRAQHRGQGKLA